MRTMNKLKHEFVVWSVIVSVFIMMTLLAIYIDNNPDFPLSNFKNSSESHSSHVNKNMELHQHWRNPITWQIMENTKRYLSYYSVVGELEPVRKLCFGFPILLKCQSGSMR